jgi:hypothetical protein
MSQRFPLMLALCSACLLAGCSSGGSSSSGSGSSLIPNKSIQLTAKHAVSLSTLATGALIVGAIYVIYDPLAPNWEIEETRLAEDTFRFSMKMKRYHTGGSGESIQVLKRRAGQLQAELGYSAYVLMEYTEGIDSQTLGARRTAEGTIRLVQRRQADSFMQN